MSNFKIHLNGSNHVSEGRKEAFHSAISDDHQVECTDGQGNNSINNGKIPLYTSQSSPESHHNTSSRISDTVENLIQISPELSNALEMGLNHSFAHQTRTMEIHQQYLDQQNEYAQLITAVLNQQGKVLENGNGSEIQGIIDTLQRGLDNFHKIREKGMEVHKQFLNQQADYSQRYVSILEKQNLVLNNGSSQLKSASQVVTYPKPESTSKQIEPGIEKVEPQSQILDDIQVSSPTIDSQSENLVIDQKVTPEILSSALLRIVGEKTGYPSEMLELDMDLEADLGIDSIKRVEILGALEDEFPTLPPADSEILAQTRTLSEIVDYMNSETAQTSSVSSRTEAQSDPGEASTPVDQTPEDPVVTDQPQSSSNDKYSVEELTVILMEIVAEKTGYPSEMLESGMDMEADLGIDSIKRVEILGAMEEQVPGLPAIEAEILAELRTLGQIVEMMGNGQELPMAPSVQENVVKKKVDPSPLDKTPIKLISLPRPDYLDFTVDQDRPLLVTDDGTDLTTQFVSALIQKGWKVILWSFHESLIPAKKRDFPTEVIHVRQEEPTLDSLSDLLNEIRDQHGLISGFIHLHPLNFKDEVVPESEQGIIKQVFFLAGAIKGDLNTFHPDGRSLFLTLTRIDGQLGLKDHQHFQESSGLSGLVKTLHWEWPDVFCRAVDLDPQLEQEGQIEMLFDEIHDPDRGLVEVGVRLRDRVTIKRDYR
jgi:acyl carrier protein